jgi:O-antigen ligase
MRDGAVIRGATRGRAAVSARPATVEEAKPWKGLGPCLFYLAVEFGRPMAWVPALAALRPGMIAALWGILAVTRKKDRRPIPRVMWYMFGLVLLMVWHVPFAMNNAWALWGLEDYAILVIGCVLPIAVLPVSLAQVRHLLTAYVFLHVPMAIHGALHGGMGMSGWMEDENDLALALNVALGVAMFLFMETTSKTKRLLLAGTMTLMIATMVVTMSRGGFVGLAALALYLVIVSPRRMTVVLLIALAVGGLFLFAPSRYWDEVRSIRGADQEGDTGEQRMYFWGMGWRMYLDHPVVGVGTRNYGIQAPYYEDPNRAEATGLHAWGRVAHSLYVTLISEQGTIGAVLFLLTIGFGWRARRRIKKESRQHPDDPELRSALLLATGLSAGMFALLVTGAFITVIYYPLLWVLAGFFGSLDAVTRGPAAPAETAHVRTVRVRRIGA